MGATTLHPFFLVMSLLGIATGLFALHQSSPHLTPYFFGFAALALVARLAVVLKGEQDTPLGTIDFAKLRRTDAARFEGWLKGNLRGHDPVIDELLGDLGRGLALAGPGHTLGAFILAGPTGTGKTFLAELVAQALFPKTPPLILRMNQYKHADDVFTLIGPPPGHPGYEVGGALTRPVLEDPSRVVLLDEIDMCHPDVRDCLYNVLDTAHCREKSSGRSVYFNACVFFATTNRAVEAMRAISRSGLESSARMGRMRDALAREAHFEKPFLARFDDVFFMDELAPIHVAEVACLRIAKHWRDYGIEVTYAAPELLLEAMRKNDDFKEYGVRQLYRLIQDLTASSIQEARRRGVDKVRLGFDGKGLIQVEAVEARAP